MAKKLNVDRETVGKFRSQLKDVAETSHVIDTLGRKQPRHRSVYSTASNQEKLETIARERPELIEAIDEGKRSVHSAYNQILKEKQKEANRDNKPLPLPKGRLQNS